MTAHENLGVQFPPIYAHEIPNLDTARQTSHEVSPEQFQQEARIGQAHLNEMRQRGQGASALHGPAWNKLVEFAHSATREPWGGATVHPDTGHAEEYDSPDRLAVTVRGPGQPKIEIPAGRAKIRTQAAMDKFRGHYGGDMTSAQHRVGVFHDAEKGTVEFDPVVVTHGGNGPGFEGRGIAQAKAIAAATHATGGAFQFTSGNGVWPNHVADVKAAARGLPDPGSLRGKVRYAAARVRTLNMSPMRAQEYAQGHGLDPERVAYGAGTAKLVHGYRAAKERRPGS